MSESYDVELSAQSAVCMCISAQLGLNTAVVECGTSGKPVLGAVLPPQHHQRRRR